MTLLPVVGVAAYALSSMIEGIAIEKELKDIKIVIDQVHNLGEMVHFLEVCIARMFAVSLPSSKLAKLKNVSKTAILDLKSSAPNNCK